MGIAAQQVGQCQVWKSPAESGLAALGTYRWTYTRLENLGESHFVPPVQALKGCLNWP
jgi:hypothetical protein